MNEYRRGGGETIQNSSTSSEQRYPRTYELSENKVVLFLECILELLVQNFFSSC